MLGLRLGNLWFVTGHDKLFLTEVTADLGLRLFEDTAEDIGSDAGDSLELSDRNL